MYEELKINQLIKELKKAAREFPDRRTGKNTQHEMEDAALGAFSVFFTQCASFLESQQEMKRHKGRSNAESLFEMVHIPRDSQIRLLLDGVEPKYVKGIFREVFEGVRSHGNSLLVALDGTEYFSSQKIHCKHCGQRELRNGKVNSFHRVLTPVVVQAGNEHVIALEPEFIMPQDEKEKQDCEIAAGKRWGSQYGEDYAKRNVTILGDDLFSRQPFIQALSDKKLHFILVCKPDSHLALQEMVTFLQTNGAAQSLPKRHWNGQSGEIYTYRYANQLPIRGDQETVAANWSELTITREDTGEQLYKNAFCTAFVVLDTTVEAIIRDGRARWKVEHENNNILKTKGYHLEHNFGHGDQHWASLLLSLNLLAFLFHTLLDLVDEKYRLIRQELRTRREVFQHIETLLCYFVFPTREDLLGVMFKGHNLNLLISCVSPWQWSVASSSD